MAFPSRPEYETLIYGLLEAHPENSALKVNFPHHYHQEPDIKHNRLPAPGISFDGPNLATLIADCAALGRTA